MTTQTVQSSAGETYAAEDVSNIVLLEHVNVQAPDQALATLFYLVGMGFTRDPHMMVGLENMWVNLGEQQFHLPTNRAQVLRGHIGIVTPSLPALAEHLKAVEPRLVGTQFAWTDKDSHIDVTCPWGNQFRCFEPAPEFGNIRTGIPYVEFWSPIASSEGIALFYQKVMGAPAQAVDDDKGKAAVVDIGPVRASGWLAWVFWLFLHIFWLIGFRNRIAVLGEWAWSYITFQRRIRLITGSKT